MGYTRLMEHLRPKLFTLIDTLTFGGLALAALVLALIASFNGLNDHVPLRGWVILWVTVTLFWAIYARYLQLRHRALKKIKYITKHGLIMMDDGGKMPSREEVEAETERTLAAWQAPWEDRAKKYPKVETPAEVLARGVNVWVREAPFQLHGKGPKFMGFARPFTLQIAVGMDGRPMERTALAHELGHLLTFRILGEGGSERALKAAHDKWGVPY